MHEEDNITPSMYIHKRMDCVATSHNTHMYACIYQLSSQSLKGSNEVFSIFAMLPFHMAASCPNPLS